MLGGREPEALRCQYIRYIVLTACTDDATLALTHTRTRARANATNERDHPSAGRPTDGWAQTRARTAAGVRRPASSGGPPRNFKSDGCTCGGTAPSTVQRRSYQRSATAGEGDKQKGETGRETEKRGGKINREGRKREEKGDGTEKRQRQREERRKKAAITFRTATTVMAGPGARSVLLPPSRYTSPLDAATAAWSLRGSRKVEFTDLIQNSQVDPAVRLKIPIRALEVTQILGQLCEL